MKIKLLRDIYVFKKKQTYDICGYDDKNWFVMTEKCNQIKFEKSRENKDYKLIK